MADFPFTTVGSTGDVVVSASGGAAVKTLAAVATKRHVLGDFFCSYSATPTSGTVKIEDGTGNVIFQQNVTQSGPCPFVLVTAMAGSVNTDLIITLSAGGTGVFATISLRGHWLD